MTLCEKFPAKNLLSILELLLESPVVQNEQRVKALSDKNPSKMNALQIICGREDILEKGSLICYLEKKASK